MKKKDYIILTFLLIIFTLLFKYNSLIKESVIDSSKIWLYNIVTSLLPIYIITDLLINYGIVNLFKNNNLFLSFISLIIGSPSNAKYIKEFYEDKLITIEDANRLLLFSYSPSPLFIINISPNIKYALIILSYIYFTNLILFLFTKKNNKTINSSFTKVSFSKCIESSINKSFKVLILILGVIIIYNIIITLLNNIFINNLFFFKIILELTNGLNITTKLGSNYLIYSILISTFGGLSIHSQIKSILEDSNISYYYFLKGRLISSIPLLFIIMFN